MTRWAAIPALVAAMLGSLVFWWSAGRPATLPDAPSSRLPCASFAPFRGSQTPFDRQLVIPEAQIEADLRLLAPHVRCVRTYSVAQGLAAVPRLAGPLGIQVMLGAWVGPDEKDNRRELEAAIGLANQYPETVIAVIVGNEVLLRRDLPAAELAKLLRDAQARTPVPVTYADVWEFWLKNPGLASDVDFVTIHTLPYWEDDPVAVDRAAEHVRATWQDVRTHLPDKPVFIGEVGWPSAGRMRDGAEPSHLAQARFVREVLALAERDGIGINIIEAFDQPWKRALEGTVGGYWGVFGADRRSKFPLIGPVVGDPAWPIKFAVAGGLGTALVLWPLVAGHRLRPLGWLALAVAGQAGGTLLVVAAEGVITGGYTPMSWAAGIGRWLLATAAIVLVTAGHLGETAVHRRPPAIAAILASLRERRFGRPDARSALGVVILATLFGATVTAVGLAIDARYRDFPLAACAVPAAALAILAWTQRRLPPRPDLREETLLALLLAVAGSVPMLVESIDNWQAQVWAAVCWLLAMPPLIEARRARIAAQTVTRATPAAMP